MTKDYVVVAKIAYDLQDASDELSEIMELFRPNIEIDEEEFKWRMAHLYNHLNTAWNVRNLSDNELEFADGKQIDLWKEFPKDLEPM
jgi:hypothetical protein